MHLKKSKILLLSIIPAFVTFATLCSLIVNSTHPTLISLHSSHLESLLPGLILAILIFAVYLYIGFLFLKIKSIFIYKIFGILNFFWFIFKILSVLLANGIGYTPSGFIFNIVVILFQVIDIYLIITYNKSTTKLINN